jgi:pyruvate/2-oxoglutarate dehydrogenase complex dihydrolipoamide acyltransferase (E2) component
MATAIKMPRLSKVATHGEVVEWLKSPGERVEAGELLFRALSEKATVEVEAPASGVLLSIIVSPGHEVPLGTLLGWIGEPGETLPGEAQSLPATVAAREPQTSASMAPVPAPPGKVRASPAARRLAADHQIALEQLVGSGPGGTITPADVQRALHARAVSPTAPVTQVPPEPLELGERLDVLTGIQRAMLSRMTQNLQTIAQATTVAEVDMTEIVRLRPTVPATLTAWVILAVTRALADYPILNASLRDDGVLHHTSVNVGVSVESEAGLLTPVIRRADTLGLAHIHRELGRLADAARAGTLAPDDMQGATFTVTNSGVLGSVLYTPMIVPPQSAILGMGRLAKIPVVREEGGEDRILIRSMMYLCLSYDHRFIYGGTAVRCLQRVRALLEQPAALVW